VDADLQGLPVSDLVALQGRLTAEFARRLGEQERQRKRPSRLRTPHAADSATARTAEWDQVEDERPRTGER
jgi:hypothetical protein